MAAGCAKDRTTHHRRRPPHPFRIARDGEHVPHLHPTAGPLGRLRIQNMTAGDLTANALLVFAVVYAQAFAILGGIMAIQRKNWKLAVVCGVASLLNFGFFLIGTFLGLAGLIAIITARRDFIG